MVILTKSPHDDVYDDDDEVGVPLIKSGRSSLSKINSFPFTLKNRTAIKKRSYLVRRRGVMPVNNERKESVIKSLGRLIDTDNRADKEATNSPSRGKAVDALDNSLDVQSSAIQRRSPAFQPLQEDDDEDGPCLNNEDGSNESLSTHIQLRHQTLQFSPSTACAARTEDGPMNNNTSCSDFLCALPSTQLSETLLSLEDLTEELTLVSRSGHTELSPALKSFETQERRKGENPKRQKKKPPNKGSASSHSIKKKTSSSRSTKDKGTEKEENDASSQIETQMLHHRNSHRHSSHTNNKVLASKREASASKPRQEHSRKTHKRRSSAGSSALARVSLVQKAPVRDLGRSSSHRILRHSQQRKRYALSHEQRSIELERLFAG